jgi:hypothetical protein
MYLEFEVLHKAHVPESCTDGMTALVELDGVTVATTGDSEAGVLIENVGLGRHWLSIRVVGEGRGDVAHETVEFVLQPGAGGGVDWSEFPVVHPEDCNDENVSKDFASWSRQA